MFGVQSWIPNFYKVNKRHNKSLNGEKLVSLGNFLVGNFLVENFCKKMMENSHIRFFLNACFIFHCWPESADVMSNDLFTQQC